MVHELPFGRKRRGQPSTSYPRDQQTATARRRDTCPLVQVRRNVSKSYPRPVFGGEMGIATDILNLRNNQLSSVTMLISALERFHDSPHDRALNRLFQVDEAADMVLTNVAAHAAEALVAQRPIGGRTPRVLSMRRNRRFKTGPSTLQRQLFAVQSVS